MLASSPPGSGTVGSEAQHLAWNGLIVGEDARDKESAPQATALSTVVEKGGRVLVLAPSVLPQGLPVKTALAPREWLSQPHIYLETHPRVKGVRSRDRYFVPPPALAACPGRSSRGQ